MAYRKTDEQNRSHRRAMAVRVYGALAAVVVGVVVVAFGLASDGDRAAAPPAGVAASPVGAGPVRVVEPTESGAGAATAVDRAVDELGPSRPAVTFAFRSAAGLVTVTVASEAAGVAVRARVAGEEVAVAGGSGSVTVQAPGGELLVAVELAEGGGPTAVAVQVERPA